MTGPIPAVRVPATRPRVPVRPADRLAAAVQTARPRQWPKNLLVFAAPLAGASLGRHDGLGYGLVAFAAFVAASSAVYFVNDVVDAERDRRHPYKRHRPVASGRLPAGSAIALAIACAAAAEAAGLAIREPGLVVVIGAYLAFSILYSLVLKHVPVVELVLVASGFVLRALGGAFATHVPPSGWFLLVCSLGALMVATAKRFSELTVLGTRGTAHRPAMRWYTPAGLRLAERVMAIVMVMAYLFWALGERSAQMRAWHLLSAVPLAVALARFDRLNARVTSKPVEDLISRDPVMLAAELCWLVLFVAGL
ncbi:MAG TPA: decaprenyl-phosphate phosphoribosyltransferase [Streptosporangiaceae bacterium]